MAEYFGSRLEAEKFIHEWFAKDQKPPVFFGKILNHGAEKWLVNYDARQNPRSSPYIQVLADCSSEVGKIVNMPWERRRRELEAEEQREEQRRREQQQREEEQRKRQAYIEEVQRRRALESVCVLCGQPLGFLDKVFRRTRHGGCRNFSE